MRSGPSQLQPIAPRHRGPGLLLVSVLALLPVTASANAGAALMWTALGHLVIGNALVGVMEGLLLAALFKAPAGRSIVWLIFANYASCGAAFLCLRFDVLTTPEITVENLRPWFWGLVAAAFIATLIIELPFFWAALRDGSSSSGQALRATLVIHFITYPLLFVMYWSVSGTSLLTQISAADLRALTPAETYDVYFITTDGQRIAKVRLGDTRQETIREVSALMSNDRLFARRNSQGKYDLGIHLEPAGKPETDEIILPDFAGQASLDYNIEKGFTDKAEGTWQNQGPAAMLATSSDWKVETGLSRMEGLRAENTKDGTRLRFALETIFFQWAARNATHLQGDFVVFQLGRDQICLAHPPTRRIALIARGKGPVVAKPKTVPAG